jgi:hypothetical protein
MRVKAFLFLFVFLSLFLQNADACGGSCLECHVKLEPMIDDTDHRVLKTCVSCHTTKPNPQGQCGQDCFDCHSKEKFYALKEVQEHQAIQQCIACHKEKVDFTAQKRSTFGNRQNVIQLFR